MWYYWFVNIVRSEIFKVIENNERNGKVLYLK